MWHIKVLIEFMANCMESARLAGINPPQKHCCRPLVTNEEYAQNVPRKAQNLVFILRQIHENLSCIKLTEHIKLRVGL